jgi:hypothetical protein
MGHNTPYLVIAAPAVAPTMKMTMDAPRRAAWGLVPPPGVDSASRPVSVKVIMLVARSRIPQRRIRAFWMPIASARIPIARYRARPAGPGWVSATTSAAMPIRLASAAKPACRPFSPARTSRPPATAPAAKQASATT